MLLFLDIIKRYMAKSLRIFGWLCWWTGLSPRLFITKQLLASGVESFDLKYMLSTPVFTSWQALYLYLFGSVLVICYFNINLTEAGVMHKGGYVYSIWST